MCKRLICWLLVICMTLSLLPARSVEAAAEKESVQTTGTYGQYTYEIHEGFAEITGCDKSVTVAEIPDTICIVTSSDVYAYPVTWIGEEAFSECKKLTSVILPVCTVGIGRFAFESCESLKNVTLPDQLLIIETGAFWYCSSLTEITIPARTDSIDESVFVGCDALNEIRVDENSEHFSVQDGALFTKDGTRMLRYPAGQAGRYTVPDGTVQIDFGAFHNAQYLTEVVMPESLTELGGSCFAGCSMLRHIELPSHLTLIPSSAFEGCSSLEYITIPETVMSIDVHAFRGAGLKEVRFPHALKSIGSGSFSSCNELRTIYIPKSVEHIGEAAFSDCAHLLELVVSEQNPYFTSMEGVLFDKKCTTLLSCPGGKTGCYTVPDGVRMIGCYAFDGCASLSRVILKGNLESIEAYAFSESSSLTHIYLPDSIRKIGGGAFSNCYSLREINLSGGITEIPSDVFENCYSLQNIHIPASITLIRENAFINCPAIDDIYYGGTPDQWEAITVCRNNECLSRAAIHYNCAKEEYVSDSIVAVLYLRSWDAEKRVAYFDNDTLLGAQATDESVIPENIAQLVGQYVLVTTIQRSIGTIPPDELISLYPVDTRVGTVTEMDESAMTVAVNGTTYTCSDAMIFLGLSVGNRVLYHLSDGKIVGLEPLYPRTGFVTAWDAENGQVTIEAENGVSAVYPLSPLADESVLIALGDSRWINVNGEFAADHNNFLYALTLEPDGEYEWDPTIRGERESWYNSHAAYARSEHFREDVVQGFTGEIQQTLETICDNPIIPIYRTMDSVQKLFHFDTDITETQEYELLLAQVLFTRTGVQSIESLYREYVPKSLIQVCDLYMGVLEESTTIDGAKIESYKKALQNLKGLSTGSIGYSDAVNELLLALDGLGPIYDENELVKALESAKFTFLVSFVSNQIGTTIDTFKELALYLASAEAYCQTADTFGQMLLEMRKHINIYSTDERFRPYLSAGQLVDDYMIWEKLGIDHANAVNCPVYLSHLAKAIEDYYLMLEQSKNGDADSIGLQMLADYVDETGSNLLIAEHEVAWSLLNCIPFVRLAHHIRSLYDGYKFAIDVFTDIDEKEYHGITVQRLYAISYVHYLTVKDLSRSVPSMEDGASEQECYDWATMFDEAVTVYRSILSTAADYSLEYAAAVYNVSDEEVWSEPHKYMYPDIHTTMGSRIWCLKLEKEILSVPWCHNRELIEEIYNRYATSDLLSFTLKCPIKVVVRDEIGAPVASLSDGSCVVREGYEHYFHVTETVSGSGEYLKTAVIPSTYTVSVIGTGEGTMDAVITELPNGEIGESYHYNDIPIHWDSTVSFPTHSSLVVDGVTYPGDSDPHVHSYGSPEFSWSADNTICEAVFVCTDCNSCVSAPCAVRSESTATCTHSGIETFTAELYFDLDTYTDTRSTHAPAAHKYDAVVTAPTCYDRGFTTCTCVFCGGSYTTNPVESLGHTLVDDVCAACGAVVMDQGQLYGHTWAWTRYDDGTLEISGTGSTYDYTWYEEHSYASSLINRIIVRPGITRLGDYSFSAAEALSSSCDRWFINIRSVELSDSVERIGEMAFCYCESLQSLTIGSGLKALEHVPFAYCPQLSEIRVSEENPYFTAIDNMLYSKDGTTIHLYPAAAPEIYTLPQGTKTICMGAFSNNSSTRELILPASIEHIESLAFTNSKLLDTVIFTGPAPEMEEDALRNADQYITITCYYPENAAGWEEIVRRSAFYGGSWVAYDPTDPPFDTGAPFSDVPYGSWYYESVLWAMENGITNGTTASTFSPNDLCMRAHVVTFLWRAVGCPEPMTETNPFVDVKESDFFYKAVLWAAENDITTGTDTTHFSPYAVCNRAQVVTFLHRTAGSPVPVSESHPFIDVKESDFYYKPTLWAVENGITNGMTTTTFGPDTSCNRAQIVTFMYRTYTAG